MKAYVITLVDFPESINSAQRCIDSASQFGIHVEIFPAVTRKESNRVRIENGLKIADLNETYADPQAVMGCFMSMYLLWLQTCKLQKPAIILEHDAIFTAPAPQNISGDVVNLGHPSFGEYIQQDGEGVFPLFSKEGGYFPGTHGYYITPEGGEKLISAAKSDGIYPTDLFLNRNRFPWLMEVYPWIIEARPKFSSIQKTEGAKSQYGYHDATNEGNNFKTVKEFWNF